MDSETVWTGDENEDADTRVVEVEAEGEDEAAPLGQDDE